MLAQTTIKNLSALQNRVASRLTKIPLLFVCFLLTSCSGKTEVEDIFETYSERLANVLEAKPPELVSPSYALNLPKIEKQTLATKTAALTLKDFYALPNCGTLKSIIAEHNTSLARVQDEVMHFLYHDALIRALSGCELNKSAKDYDSQRTKIQEMQNLKRQDRAISWRNFLYTDKDFLAAFTTTAQLKTLNTESYTLSLNEFTYLQSLSEKVFKAALDARNEDNMKTLMVAQQDLVNALKHIARQKFPAKLWNTLSYLKNNLEVLNTYLEDELSALNCATPKGKKQSDYLNNVMRIFFIEQIQPFASSLNKQHYQLTPLLNVIYALPNNVQPETKMSDFISQQNVELFEGYRKAVLTHVQIWQKMFKECGIKAGA